MRIYNTLTKNIENIFDNGKKEVRMYVCGLTPYDSAHLGHARTGVSFDVLKRFLIFKGAKVKHVQNITDIEDKIINRSAELGIPPVELAEKYHNEALTLFDKLNIIRADRYPKVSDHIKDIIQFILELERKGYAYRTGDGVYFSVEKFKEYGKLSGQRIEELKKGERNKGNKKSVIDFALWKNDTDVISFESPFGRGRPGWHIECSVMALKYLNAPLDIHGGARDLIFPHHENEIAQSEAYLEGTFSRLWVHTGFLTVNGEKMSKSLGNFITVKDALEKYGAGIIRMFFVSYLYSSPVDYDEKNIGEAGKKLEKIRTFKYLMRTYSGNGTDEKRWLDKFLEHMENNLNTPNAIASMFDGMKAVYEMARKKTLSKEGAKIAEEELEKALWILGLDRYAEPKEPDWTRIEAIAKNEGIDASGMDALEMLISERARMREERNYKDADRIRRELRKAGIMLEDEGKSTSFRII